MHHQQRYCYRCSPALQAKLRVPGFLAFAAHPVQVVVLAAGTAHAVQLPDALFQRLALPLAAGGFGRTGVRWGCVCCGLRLRLRLRTKPVGKRHLLRPVQVGGHALGALQGQAGVAAGAGMPGQPVGRVLVRKEPICRVVTARV